MKSYIIHRCDGAPDWPSIPSLAVDQAQWLPAPDIRMTTQLCYDDQALYLHQRAWEQNIRAEHDAPLSMVCEDSCMEFFFCPVVDDPRYFNFECNPNGRTYIGFSTGRADVIRLAPPQEDMLLQKQVHRCDGGWELFYQIPLPFLRLFFPGLQFAPGQSLRANCYKCGDLTVHPHYLAWHPIDSPTPEFHRSCDFGTMTFA